MRAWAVPGSQSVKQDAVINGFAVQGNSLIDSMEIGARVAAHSKSQLNEQCRNHGGGRSLAVGARDVNNGRGVVWVAKKAQGFCNTIKRRQQPSRGSDSFVVDMTVEPAERLIERGERSGHRLGGGSACPSGLFLLQRDQGR